MDLNTLTFYAIGALLSFSLALVLVAFTYIQPGTRMSRTMVVVILIIAVAFFGSGYGLLLPRWVTVIGTNMLFLLAQMLFYTGLRAYCGHEPSLSREDWLSWGLIGLTGLPFWYWGIEEPSGLHRSVIFSWVSAIVSIRSTRLLLTHYLNGQRQLPLALLTLCMMGVAIWMGVRGVVLLQAEPAPVAQRALNPTTWVTVFWYIVVISWITITILWLEIDRLKAKTGMPTPLSQPLEHSLSTVRGHLLLLWHLVAILALALVSEVGIGYAALYEKELNQQQKQTQLAKRAFTDYTYQWLYQIDSLLKVLQKAYDDSGSMSGVASWLRRLDFPEMLVENVYLLDDLGTLQALKREQNRTINHITIDKEIDFFRLQHSSRSDSVYIGSVQIEPESGQWVFPLIRWLSRAEGSFAGLLLVTIRVAALADYYRSFPLQQESRIALIQIPDHQLLVRVPEIDSLSPTLTDSLLWEMLNHSSEGQYSDISDFDGIERQFFYQRLGDLPLVMVTGFSTTDVQAHTVSRIQPIALGSLLAILTLLTLAGILTTVIRRQDEQERLISMLSHELKTPLSTISLTLGRIEVSSVIKQRIERNIQAINTVIDRCLQSDRLQMGKVTMTRGHCDLRSLFDGIRAQSMAPNRLNWEEERAILLESDCQLLDVILSNLMDNGLKYGATGSAVTVHATQNAKGVTIKVINQIGAVGIPDRHQLFRKYYRSPSAHGQIGSGLGLYLSAGLAKKLGGSLSYQLTSTQITFVLWIPS